MIPITFIPRAQVGYDETLPRLGYYVPPAKWEGFVTHHTVGADSDDTRNRWENLDEIIAKARYHQRVRPDLGLDVPYSFLIFWWLDSEVWKLVVCEGRGWHRTGAHTAGNNTRLIAEGHVGDFRYIEGVPDEVLDDGMYSLGAWTRSQALVEGIDLPVPEIGGHKDYKTTTSCPGGRLYSRLDLFETGYLEGSLMTVSAEVLALLEAPDAAEALGFAMGQARKSLSIGAGTTSEMHELNFFRALASWLDVDARDEAAMVAALEAKLADPGAPA